MNDRLSKFLFASIFIITCCNSQTTDKEAKAYFNQYLNSKEQFELISKSLPTFGQCQKVFKNEYASEYFEFISNLNEQIEDNLEKIEFEEHIECKIVSFTTSDLSSHKNAGYTSNMHEYSHVFKSNVTFYRLTYLLKNGKESVRSIYKFFVNIDGDWLFFANPAIIFRE